MSNTLPANNSAEKLSFTSGREFRGSSPSEVLEFLKTRKVSVNEMDRRDIRFLHEGGKAMVELKLNGRLHRILQRHTFSSKLLNWFRVPENLSAMLTPDVFIAMQNQLLGNITSNKVFLKTENHDALSIFSSSYKEVSDISVFESLRERKVEKVSRNDRMTRFITERKADREIKKGDIFGFGHEVINSETGFAAVSYSHYLLRYICDNGASVRVWQKNSKLNHHIDNTDKLKRLLSELDTNWNSESDAIIAKLKQADQLVAQPFADRVINGLNAITGYKQSSQILREFDWGQPLYEVFNHLTHSAKSFPVHLRYRIESFAGELIFLADPRKLTDLEYLEN